MAVKVHVPKSRTGQQPGRWWSALLVGLARSVQSSTSRAPASSAARLTAAVTAAA
ncbi:hypothetical protein [Streptomyces sp. cg35]|uniref:hypothetical protein n=1 Tax=Streptomyces sp. cg35 TaxID=3421650 RepID=UPI003D183BDA